MANICHGLSYNILVDGAYYREAVGIGKLASFAKKNISHLLTCDYFDKSTGCILAKSNKNKYLALNNYSAKANKFKAEISEAMQLKLLNNESGSKGFVQEASAVPFKIF